MMPEATRPPRAGDAGGVTGPGTARFGVALVLGLMLASAPLVAQRLGEAKGFRLAEYYGPPHQAQLKSLLKAAKGLPLEGGKQIVLTDMELQTFSETNSPELLITAPHCLYDSSSAIASSPGPLRVQTADGKFSIEGEGFLWRQTNSSLFISNQVHTIVQPELLAANAAPRRDPGAPESASIEIRSEQFEYGANTGLGLYHRAVRMSGTNLLLTAGLLTVALPVHERQVHNLTADEDTVIDYGRVHATGQHVVYEAQTGFVRVTGEPTWRAEEREGRGDELFIDRTNKIFRANGHAWMQMPSRSVGESGFFPQSASTNSLAATNQFVEIRSDSYEIHTNWAVFREDVNVRERLEEQTKGTMVCKRMTLTFAGTNQLDSLTAEEHVVLDQETNRFTGDHAVYYGTNGLLTLTGQPSWQSGPRSGHGELVQLSFQTNEMLVRSNAFMQLPAEQLATSSAGLGAAPNPPPKTDVPQFAEIVCSEYTVAAETAVFLGGVRVRHPQMNWLCRQMHAQLQPAEGADRRLIADDAVTFDMTDAQGQKVHGTGDRAVYTYAVTGTLTNELLRLTGNQAVLVTSNGVMESSVILLDLAHNRISTPPGTWKMRGKLSLASTNAFGPPAKPKAAK